MCDFQKCFRKLNAPFLVVCNEDKSFNSQLYFEMLTLKCQKEFV